MGFTLSFGVRENNVVRAYLHNAGIELYGEGSNSISGAANHLLEVIERYPIMLKKYDVVLAAMRGRKERNERVIEFFGFEDTSPWPGNPVVSTWVTVNGLYLPDNNPCNPVTCGDSLIMLGEEEKLRRTTHSLDEYMRSSPPKLAEISESRAVICGRESIFIPNLEARTTIL